MSASYLKAKQLGRSYIEGVCEPAQVQGSHVPLPTFKGTDVGAVEPALQRQSFLRQSARLPEVPDAMSQGGEKMPFSGRTHELTFAGESTMRLRTMSL